MGAIAVNQKIREFFILFLVKALVLVHIFRYNIKRNFSTKPDLLVSNLLRQRPWRLEKTDPSRRRYSLREPTKKAERDISRFDSLLIGNWLPTIL